MDLDKILLQVREKFSPRKKIDFEEQGLHFELEPLTVLEETKILTALKEVEDTQYVASLKRHSLACAIKRINEIDLGVEDVEYIDDKGDKKLKSKYLYMVDYLSKWPSPLLDSIFEIFSDMNREAELKIKKDAKFERFILSEKVAETEKKKFKPLDETIPAEEMTQEERLEKKVEKEIDEANSNLARAEIDAEK